MPKVPDIRTQIWSSGTYNESQCSWCDVPSWRPSPMQVTLNYATRHYVHFWRPPLLRIWNVQKCRVSTAINLQSPEKGGNCSNKVDVKVILTSVNSFQWCKQFWIHNLYEKKIGWTIFTDWFLKVVKCQRIRNGGWRRDIFYYRKGKKKIYFYLTPRRYPLVFLVKVDSRQGRERGSEYVKCDGK